MRSPSPTAHRRFFARALIACIAGLLLFALISAEVINTGPVLRFDARWAERFHVAAGPTARDVFTVITAFGSPVLYVIGFGLGAIFIWRRAWTLLAGWVLATAGTKLLNIGLKALFARSRPDFADVTLPDVYGYPSGHTMHSAAAYGMLAYFVWIGVRNPRLRAAAILGAALLTGLVGLSRLALSVHYVSDVIGGVVAGTLWLGVAISITEALRAREAVYLSNVQTGSHVQK
jgi:membrane-associated phospholipid phosphatase